MQRPFDFLVPELHEAEQLGMIGRQIVFLPDETVQNTALIGHPVIELGGGQAIALEHQLGFTHIHAQTSFLLPVRFHLENVSLNFNKNSVLAVMSAGCQIGGPAGIAPHMPGLIECCHKM